MQWAPAWAPAKRLTCIIKALHTYIKDKFLLPCAWIAKALIPYITQPEISERPEKDEACEIKEMQGLNTWESRQGQAAWGRKEENLDWFAVTSASSYLLTKKREIGCAVAKKRLKAPANRFAMQRPFIEKRRGEKAREIKEAVDTPTWIAEREKKGKIKWEAL